MILMLVCPLIGLVSLQFFALNYSIQGLNRAIISAPIELMYKGVLYLGEVPLVIKEDFQDIMMSYYDSVIPRYSKEYEVDFYFYNVPDQSMCLYYACKGVEITIDCKLITNYKFHRVMYYEMKDVLNG